MDKIETKITSSACREKEEWEMFGVVFSIDGGAVGDDDEEEEEG